MAHDARALSYHDVVLRNADVDLLTGPYWLNDQVIAFYFELLMREAPTNLNSKLAMMPGASSFLLLNSDPSEAALIFEQLKLHEKELVVFAVNDNPDVEMAAGGSHWSCLAYVRSSNSFRHYDSSSPHNRSIARSLAGAATPLVRSKANATGTAHELPSFVEVKAMPRQLNSYDCGMYVLAVTRVLHESLLTADNRDAQSVWQLQQDEEVDLLNSITPGSVQDMRGQILSTITRLASAAQAQ